MSDDGPRQGAEPAPPGVGIGLSVCRRLLRAEGARVEPPDLHAGGGCTVRVVLRAMPRDGGRPRSRGPVVVIDDHDLLGSSLVVMMARHGFYVRRVPVGAPESILAQAGTANRGVALLDLDLGVGPSRRRISGIDLVAPLRVRGGSR